MTLLAKRLVDAKVLTPDLAKFVSVPILLDTSMFKPELKVIKWTDGDLENYENIVKANNGEDLKPLGLRLHHVKKDVKKNLGLGCFKLLVKDFKIYKMVPPSDSIPTGVFIGVATLPVPLKAVLDHFGVDGVAEEMLGLMKSRDFHYFMIITSYNDEQGGKHKEINLFYNQSIPMACRIDGVVKLWDNNELLKSVDREQELCSIGTMYSWDMKDTRNGRKGLEKELKKFYAQNTGEISFVRHHSSMSDDGDTITALKNKHMKEVIELKLKIKTL